MMLTVPEITILSSIGFVLVFALCCKLLARIL